eukprot:5739089-Amphidinium_carterae.1
MEAKLGSRLARSPTERALIAKIVCVCFLTLCLLSYILRSGYHALVCGGHHHFIRTLSYSCNTNT